MAIYEHTMIPSAWGTFIQCRKLHKNCSSTSEECLAYRMVLFTFWYGGVYEPLNWSINFQFFSRDHNWLRVLIFDEWILKNEQNFIVVGMETLAGQGTCFLKGITILGKIQDCLDDNCIAHLAFQIQPSGSEFVWTRSLTEVTVKSFCCDSV